MVRTVRHDGARAWRDRTQSGPDLNRPISGRQVTLSDYSSETQSDQTKGHRVTTRILTGLATGLLLFGLVFGAAASLSTTEVNNVGAVSAEISACDSDGISIEFASTDGLELSAVTIGDIADLCNGLTVTANIEGSSATGTVSSDGSDSNSVELDFSDAGISLDTLTAIDVSIL